jgi:GYF domain 2
MNDDAWWYESSGAQAGPVAEDVLRELIRSGRLRPEARVWRSGMPTWLPVASVAELARELPAGPPPLLQPGPGAGLPPGLEPVPTGAVIGLGILTLGIYPMVKFYQAALAYEQLAARRSRFTLYFWLSVAFALGGGPLHVFGGVPGVFAHVAAIVFTVLTLVEVLAVRAEALRRCGIAPVLTSETTHKALFIAGLLTSWLFVGVVLLVVQAVKFFGDHRAIGEALAATRTPSAAMA